MLKLFRWCTYDWDPPPDRKDQKLESWTNKGLPTYLSLSEKNTLHSFQHLQNKHGLENELYNALFDAKKDNTLYIKEKWEEESDLNLSEEAWGEIWSFQWSSTNSAVWREHCWKRV